MKSGEIWIANLSPVVGHEQDGERPVLILSCDVFNDSKASLVIVAPITTSIRNIRTRVKITPEDTGLMYDSQILVDHIRSISKDRLKQKITNVNIETMEKVKEILQNLLDM